MPFPTKIQPIDSHAPDGLIQYDPVKPVVKSRLKRLFERQFPSVLKISSVEKPAVGESQNNRDGGATEFEPSSVCLAKMVQSFIEENNYEKQSVASKCRRKRCNCFNGSCSGSSDGEFDISDGFGDSIQSASSGEGCEILKSLVPCASISERNLLADTAKIIEKNSICKRKDDYCRKIVTAGLLALGYDSSICKSRWEKSHSYPAGEYEYVDAIIDGERLLIDIDFRSEFEIARSTGNYKAILQVLPQIFVGKPDRLHQIVCIVSEAAKRSLKKKGMHIPPWRKTEYIRAKWLSPYSRTTSSWTLIQPNETTKKTEIVNQPCVIKTKSLSSEFEMIFGENSLQTEMDSMDSESSSPGSADEEEKMTVVVSQTEIVNQPCVIKTKSLSSEFEMIFGENSLQTEMDSMDSESSSPGSANEEEKMTVVVSQWQPPVIKPRSSQSGRDIFTGLASVIKEQT